MRQCACTALTVRFIRAPQCSDVRSSFLTLLIGTAWVAAAEPRRGRRASARLDAVLLERARAGNGVSRVIIQTRDGLAAGDIIRDCHGLPGQRFRDAVGPGRGNSRQLPGTTGVAPGGPRRQPRPQRPGRAAEPNANGGGRDVGDRETGARRNRHRRRDRGFGRGRHARRSRQPRGPLRGLRQPAVAARTTTTVTVPTSPASSPEADRTRAAGGAASRPACISSP